MLAGMLGGLLYSLQRDQALPYLKLAYYPAIDRMVAAGEYRAALDQLAVAIHLDFLSRERIYDEIARIAMTNGQLDDHIRASRGLMDLGVIDSLTRINLAGSLLLRGKPGDYPEAEQLSRQLLDELPSQPEVNCNLGAALLAQNKPEEARPYFQRALQVDPGFSPAQQGLLRIQQVRPFDE
ncbi:MAG: tetratricopeptide repeat protein [Pirellulaceae bacterium]|nr:tetratricopeptide repeat protein [Pirellulaceae bacterium]